MMEEIITCDRKEDVRQISQLKKKFEAKLKDAERAYNKVKDAHGAAVKEFTEIQPTLNTSKTDTGICHVTGSASFVVGGILLAIGIFAAPLTAGTSLALTIAGASVTTAGGIVTIGATVGNSIVKSMNFSRAKKLLETFQSCKSQLSKELDDVYEVSKIINNKKNQEKYQLIFEIMFPENTVQYKILNVYDKSPDLITPCEMIKSMKGVTKIAKNVIDFTNALEKLAVQGAKVTKSLAAKILIPIGIAVDTAFLIFSIVELAQGKKCKVAQLVGLMKETIEKEMEDIDDISSKLYGFHLEENVGFVKETSEKKMEDIDDICYYFHLEEENMKDFGKEKDFEKEMEDQ